MAGGKPIIGIRFGVDPQSAGIIKTQLEQLTSKIKLDVIQLNIDESHFNAQLTKLQQEIKNKLGEVKINLTTGTATQGKKGSSSGAAVTEAGQYEAVKNKLFEIYNLKEQLNKQDAGSRKNIELRERIDGSVQKLKEQYQILQNISGADSERITKINELNRALSEANQKSAQPMASQTSVAKLALKAQSLSTDNGFDKVIARSEEARTIVANFQQEVNTALNQPDGMTQQQVQNLNTKFLETETRLKQIQSQTNTLGNKFKETFKTQIIQRFGYVLIMAAMRAVRQLYTNVVEINTALTELKIVTQATSEEMEESFERVSNAAKKIGANIKDLIKSVTVYARLGYGLKDAEVLAEKTTIYANVAGVNVDEATTNITGIIKAFNIGADGLEAVLDQMIWVGNNFAISQAEIGEAMNNAASSLAANGNSLQEAIAIVTAANTTLQNVSKSSTAVRTIAARISASTTELEALGESTDGILATANLDARMRAFGVAITDSNGQLRKTYDILADLAKVWDELETTERAAIAGMVAGTKQQNAFYSIMQNWGDAERVVAKAAEGVGSLARAQETHLDSIEGKTEQLKASWQDFSQNLLESDLVKFFVDLLKVIAEVLNWIISLGDRFAVKFALVGVAVWAATKTIGAAFTWLKGWGIASIKDFWIFAKMAAEDLGKALLKLVQNPYIMLTLLIAAMLSIKDNGAKIIISIIALVAGAAVAIVNIVKTADRTIKTIFASNVIGWILLAVGALVSAIVAIVDALKKPSFEDLKEAADEAKEKWEAVKTEVEELEKELGEVNSRIDELNGKKNLTLVEQSELEKLQQENTLLEQQLAYKKELALIKEKNAATSSMAAIDSLRNKYTSDYVKKILSKWETLPSSIKQTFLQDYLQNLTDLTDEFTYYTGDNLQDWQKKVNEYLDAYYLDLDKYSIASGNAATAWTSIVNRIKFKGAVDSLTDFANSGKVTEETLKALYNSDAEIKAFIDYLQQIGLFAWDSSEKMGGLINQINSLADVAQKPIEIKLVDSLEKLGGEFDALNDVLTSIRENGIASADSLKELINEYPELIKYFKATSQGYIIGDNFSDGINVLEDYITNYLQGFADEVAKYEKGTEEWAIAQKNFNTAITASAMVLRSLAIEEMTKPLEEQQDRLEEQIDKYKELIDIRRGLLETYQEELDYQKELAEKQKNVADLETQLALSRLDKSAAGQARTRELEQELKDAQDELDEYTLERAILDIENKLDSSYNAYKELIDNEVTRLETAINGLKDSLKINITLDKDGKVNVGASTDGSDGTENGNTEAYKPVPDSTTEPEVNTEPEEQPKEEVKPKYTLHGKHSNNTGLNMFHKTWSISKYASKVIEIDGATYLPYNRGGTKDTYVKLGEGYDTWVDGGKQVIDFHSWKPLYHITKNYHTGGFVGDNTYLRSNEEFAKLLKGEFVSTPAQMDRFMKETLPAVVMGSNSGSVEYNAPIFEINCGDIDREALPALQEIINQAVAQFKKEMQSSIGRTGLKKNFNK